MLQKNWLLTYCFAFPHPVVSGPGKGEEIFLTIQKNSVQFANLKGIQM